MAKSKSTDHSAAPEHDADPVHGDDINLAGDAQSLFVKAGVVGLIGVGATVLLGMGAGASQFLHSYLVAYVWVLSIAIGALWWVTLQHLVGAKWSVVVRRVGEILASNMPIMALLILPIVVPVMMGDGTLHIWANVELVHSDHMLHMKAPYLNKTFFFIRVVFYFGFWSFLGWRMLKNSVEQDKSGRPELMKSLQTLSAPGMILIGLTLTFCAFDLLMSLDPYWFSTIFGVYYFAGCVISVHCVLGLTLMWLQSKGRLKRSVTQEHYHDIGKMMFAFTVFWAYIGFSQFMLIWYANIPEETAWYKERFAGDWKHISLILLVCHFVLPFFGLLSRHIKRSKAALAFWAVWLLCVHWVDMYWLVMPKFSHEHLPFHLLDLTSLMAVAGLFVASAAFKARRHKLVPIKDPRLAKSLAFENF